jgi:GTP-binding protein
VIVHLVDVGSAWLEERPVDAPLADWQSIRAELASYDAGLAARTEIVALNKLDLMPEDVRELRLAALETALRARGREVVRVSGATGEGVDVLLRAVLRVLDATDPARSAETAESAAS